jgi:hypothetical protein
MGLFKKAKKPTLKVSSEIEPEYSGIYIDAVKRPVRHRPVSLSVLKATARREKRNSDARKKRAQLRQLDKLTIAVKG